MKFRLRTFIWLIPLIILLLLSGFFMYIFLFGGLEDNINNQLESIVENKLPLIINVGNVKGNLISGVVLEDVSIRYFDSVYNYEMLRIPQISAGYSLSNLWNMNFSFSYVYIDSVYLQLLTNDSGKIIMPHLGGEEGQEKPLFVKIDQLQVNESVIEIKYPKDTLLLSNISLNSAIEVSNELVTASVQHLSFNSNRKNLNLTSANGDFTLSKNNIVFKDFNVVTNQTRIKLSGSMNLNEFLGEMDISVLNLDLSSLKKFSGPVLKGNIDLHGHIIIDSLTFNGMVDVSGSLEFFSFDQLFVNFEYSDKVLLMDSLYGSLLSGCTIDGNGILDFTDKTPLYRLNAAVKDFNLQTVVKNAPVSNISGEIFLEGSSFKGDSLKIELETELSESMFGDYPIHTALGSMLITKDSLRLFDPYLVTYYEDSFSVNGLIEFNDQIDLEIIANLPRLDRYTDKLFIEKPSGRATVITEMTGLSSNPDISGQLQSDSLWIYGLYSDSAIIDFDIDKFIYERDGEVVANFYNGALWSIFYDSLSLELILDSTKAFVSSSTVETQFASISSTGSFDYTNPTTVILLDDLNLSFRDQKFVNDEKIRVYMDSIGFDFDHLSIETETAELSLKGRFEFDETMDGKLKVSKVLIAPWLNLFNQDYQIDGYMSGEIDFSGNFENPDYTIYSRIDSLTYRGLYLGELQTSSKLSNKLLKIDSLVINSENGHYQAIGEMHVDLSISNNIEDPILDKPMKIDLKAHDTQFDLVSLILPTVEELSGNLQVNCQLTGTVDDPHLIGYAYVKNAALKYFDLADTLFSDSAGVDLIDNQVIINRIDTYVKERKKNSRRRSAIIGGSITILTLNQFDYDIDVNIPDYFPFRYDLEDIEGVVKGSISVEGSSPPLVTGDLEILSMMYRANFATAEEGSPIMMAFSGENSWDLDINIDINSNYWIKNDNIDAEFGGFINLKRESGRYRFVGEMEVFRGQSFFFQKIFRLEPYSTITFEDTEYPNPRLDIIAHTRVATSQFEEEERNGLEELSIHVTGTLEEPEFNTTTGDTAFSREDILPLIVANSYSGQSSSNRAFEQRVTDMVSSQLSRIGSRQLSQIGVETFEIDPNYGGNNDLSSTQITLGRYISPNLYVFGSSTISGQSGQAVGFEYRFNRSLRLEGRRDEEELYHLNFNLNWEF